MRPVRRRVLAFVVIALLVVGAFLGGWYAHSTVGSSGPTTLAIIAAGSLSPSSLLPAFASDYANANPGVSAPTSAQLYEGSTAAATTIAAQGTSSIYDVFVSADFRVIPQHLIDLHPSYASGEAVFASDPLVLTYDPAAIPGITSQNWATKIVAPGVLLGVPNASADPLGANVIVALELEDALAHQGGALYSHFFSGPMGGFATPTGNARYVPEGDASAALASGEVQAYLTYASYARANALSYVGLNASVNLGGFTPSDVRAYGNARTTVLSGSSSKVVAGAPALFALTVPTNAPDPAVGDGFSSWLLSNATSSAWASDGFLLTPTLWTVGSVPFLPSGEAALPPYLAALL